MSRLLSYRSALLSLWLLACSTADPGPSVDANSDVATIDAATADAARDADLHDARFADADRNDAQLEDAGRDADFADASTSDAELHDASTSDANIADSSDHDASDASDHDAGDSGDICSGGCDPDECAMGLDNCAQNARCDDLDPGFACTCLTGFSGNGISCTDINECMQGTDSCDRNPVACVNTQGSFMCVCPPGYEGDGIASIGCTDIDECARNTDDCTTGRQCTNTPGGFSCGCDAGFQLSGNVCVDVDECQTNTHDCSVYAICANTSGSFSCACPAGFTGNGRTCTDVNECGNNTDNCHANAVCTNIPGAFSCACNSGFDGNGVTCTDIDECTLAPAMCDTSPLATCANTSGAFTCACPSGFSGTGVGSSGCFDVNECINGTHTCGPNGSCINTSGGYSCTCNAGYVLSGTVCVDRDECALNTDGCDSSPNACVNTPGSFMCVCPTGYNGTGVGTSGCSDRNECTLNTDNCHANATCTNSIGSFNCACNTGYGGDGVICEPFTYLSGLQTSVGNLNPVFSAMQRDYIVGVPIGTTSITVTPSGVGTLRVNNTIVSSGAASAPIAISGPGATIQVSVVRPGFALTSYRVMVVIGAPTYLKEFSNHTNRLNQYLDAVALDADTAVVGAVRYSPTVFEEGAAYVYTRTAGVWSTQAQLREPVPGEGHVFGAAVAVDGDTIAVSSQNPGRVYVFTRSAGVWSFQTEIVGANTASSDRFGSALSLSGNTLVVGAVAEGGSSPGINGPDNDALPNSGAVYVFTRSGTVWTQQAYIKASNPGSLDYFGDTLAIDGNVLVVGAWFEDSNASGVNGDQANNSLTNAGAAYVYTRSGTTWSQQAYLKPLDPTAQAWFGQRVAISGNTIAINGSGTAAYVFVSNAGVWSQQARLVAANAESNDGIRSIAVSGNRLLFGVANESSNAFGINGDGTNNDADNSGAAYLFTRSGTTWTQTSYIKAPNAETGDRFGMNVAMDGTTFAISAPFERSNASGVNGNMLDNSAGDAGAVYVYP